MRSKNRFHTLFYTVVGLTVVCLVVAIGTAFFKTIYQPEDPELLNDLFNTMLHLTTGGIGAVFGMLGSHLTPGDN